ncbi:MAG: methyltransferase domain-containing protein [Armatimonadota bacterium]|nr:methyltransferase domain-containing protein [bacterium]
MTLDYVHGYSEREAFRLVDQATTLTEILHSDTYYEPDSNVLEAGCGVGAQTITLASNSPLASFTSVDISSESVNSARSLITAAGITNVTFRIEDIFNLSFESESFDHVFVCFVLEHLSEPLRALQCLKRVLKPGGTITVIEGDHGSCYFSPDSDAARAAIACLVRAQASGGGDSLIGRRLYPLLCDARFKGVSVSPRMVYVDAGKPHLVDGFTRKTFTAMVEGVREEALASGMIDQDTWDQGIRDLYRTTEPDGTFCYTFFKATAIK